MLGAACYITGYMASAFIGTNQSAFIGVWFTFVGIGSGLLYWTTFAIASSWFEGSDKMKVIGYAAITPSLYVGIFPFVYSGMVGMSYAIDPWSVVFVTLASVGALMMALSWVFVKTNRPSSAGKDNEDPFANQWAGLTFAFMMLGAFLFQAQFYIPYIRLPPYVIEVLGGSEAAQSATTALFGWGSLVGRVFAALFATPTAFRGHVLSMQLVVFSGAMGLFYMLWGLQNGLAYVQAFAFMYGATSGACYVDIMMMLHSYWVRAFKPMNDERQLMFKLGVYGACLSVGQIVSAFVFYYGVPSYTNTIIYAGSVAAGACIFFFIVALFAFTPR
jgi:MFS family permease